MADSIHDKPSDEKDPFASDSLQSMKDDSTEATAEVIASKSVSTFSLQSDPPTTETGATGINVSDPTIISTNPPFDIIVNENLNSTEQISIPEPIAQAGALPIGSTIGHFRIAKYIGGGGMGRVYEGIDLALDRKVAIKILPRQRAQDQASVARFLNEAKSAARLNHEHIAQVYFCGEENGIPYIAFEYVQGVNLRNYVTQHGILSLKLAVDFLLQISGALAHAAKHGVTHRDVKPSNILITPQGKAKLIDMGLARLLRSSDPDEELTVSGVTLGTFDYISPEQARDPRLADVRSDIYSLGCTFFFMMAGQPPFPEGTVLQKLLKHQGDQPPDIRKFVPETPAEVVALMQKMMAKDPADRYQTPDELIVDLNKIADQYDFHFNGPVEPLDFGRIRGRKRRIFFHHLPWISAVVLLFAVVAGYYFSAHTGKKSEILPPSITRPVKPGISRMKSPPENGSLKTLPPETAVTDEIPRLPARQLSPRDRIHGIGNEFNASDKTAVAMSLAPRLAGGFGIAPVSSNDLPRDAEFQNLSEKTLGAIEVTVAPESDSFSDSWFPLRRIGVRFPTPKAETILPDGTDPIVDGIGKKAGCYTTLEEALAHAMERSRGNSGGMKEVVVKLAVDGDLVVSPTTLAFCDIKLVAATGFTPRVVFQPREASGDALSSTLFTLRSARLTLANLTLFFDVTSQEMISDEWSMIRLDPLSSLTVVDSFLTIRNQTDQDASSYHPDVAFFRCDTLPALGKQPLDDSEEIEDFFSPTPAVSNSDAVVSTGERTRLRSETLVAASNLDGATFNLEKTFLRGEATLLAVRSVPNVRLKIDATAFVLNGPAVRYEDYSAPSALDFVSLTVSLDRVFGWCRAPLFQIKRQSLVTDHFGKEIDASVNQSLMILSDNPLGEITVSVPQEEHLLSPNWKITDSLLFNVASLVRYRWTERLETSRDIPLTPFGAHHMETISGWNVLKTTPPHQITLGRLEHDLLQPMGKSLETDKQRSILSAFENGFIVPFGETFGQSN